MAPKVGLNSIRSLLMFTSFLILKLLPPYFAIEVHSICFAKGSSICDGSKGVVLSLRFLIFSLVPFAPSLTNLNRDRLSWGFRSLALKIFL